MDTVGNVQFNQIPKMVKVVSRRTGRLFYKPIDQMSSLSSQRLTGAASSSSMQNPVVLASLIAGFVGVLIIFVLIFTVWVRRRCIYSQEKKDGENPTELESCSSSFANFTGLHSRCVSNDTFFTVNEEIPSAPEEEEEEDEDSKDQRKMP